MITNTSGSSRAEPAAAAATATAPNGARRARTGPEARSWLLTVLGEYVRPRARPVWTGTLVATLGAVGVREKAARQALARSASGGWLTGQRLGRRVRYDLTPSTRALLVEGARRIYSFGDGRVDWDGRWLVLVTTVPEEQRQLRHKLRTGLTWAGFGPLGQGIWVTPDASRDAEAKRVLEGLGPAVQASSFVGPHALVGDEAAVVARAWDLPDLERRYHEFLAAFTEREPKTLGEAFADQTRLVHEWRRFPLLDPGLPDMLLPRTWPGRPARELFERRHTEWARAAQEWFDEVDATAGDGE